MANWRPAGGVLKHWRKGRGSAGPDASRRGAAGEDPDLDFRSVDTWRRIGHVSVAVWVSIGFGFFGTVVAARALGPRAYGEVVLAVSIASLIALFLDLTLEEGVIHHGTKALSEGDHATLRGILRTALFVDLAIGLTVSGAMIVWAGPLADLVSGGTVEPVFLRLAALTTLATTVDGTTGAVLLIARRPALRAWSIAITNMARLLLVLVAVRIGDGGAVLVAFAFGSAIGSGIQALLSWRVAWRQWSRAPAGRAWKWVRPLFSFGLHSSLATSAVAANRTLVKVVLGRIGGPRVVGILDVAMFPLSAVGLVSSPLRLWFFPEQARLWADGKVDRLRAAIRTYTLGGLAVGTVGAVLGWFALPYLLPLFYSDRFSSAVGPARIILVAAVMILATAWRKNLAAAIGRPQVRTITSLAELVVLVASLMMLARFGAIGGAIALAITSVVVAATWWVLSQYLLRNGHSLEDLDQAP